VEFESNQPASDEQRHLAEAKKITLQPLHAGITPDPIPDAEIAARKTRETSPNISIDSEDTNTKDLMQPSRSALNKSRTDKHTISTRTWPAAATVTIIPFVIIATAWLWVNAT
jgi:hypothetical protein